MASNWLSYQDCYNFIFHGKMVTQQSQSILFFMFCCCCCSSYPFYFTFYKCLPASEDMYICVYIYLFIYTELRVLISYIVRCFREENFYFSLLPAISDSSHVLIYVYNSVNAC